MVVSQVDRGLTARKSWSTRFGLTTQTTVTFDGQGGRTETILRPDDSEIIRIHQDGRLQSEEMLDANSNRISKVSYDYDPHGRMDTITDVRAGTTTQTFNDADQVLTLTTPSPGLGGGGPQLTEYRYDEMGRRTKVIHPDGSETEYDHWPAGELKSVSGSQVYPVSYTYDPQGRMKTMTTTGQAGPGVTTWNYDPQRGWLNNKRYADNQGPDYTYTDAGRLHTRTWARNLVTTYGYDGAGDLASVSYSDTTPGVTYIRDRLGREEEVSDGVGTWEYDRHLGGMLEEETVTGGVLDGLIIERTPDSLLRLDSLEAGDGTVTWVDVGYGYNAASRLQTVSAGGHTATYGYVPDSSLVHTVTFNNGSGNVLTTERAWDNLNRLHEIDNSISGASDLTYTYTYNDLNQRTRVDLADGSYWVYQYNGRGEVVSGRKFWPNGAPVSGQQFGYEFDEIGNRTNTTTNGRQASWSANALNQYTSRQVPGAFDILGRAHEEAVVTVDGQNALRGPGGYWHAEIEADNSQEDVFEGITIFGVRVGAGPQGENVLSEEEGSFFLPQTPEAFTHDDDGNLTRDGQWDYLWDAENRLIRMETRDDLVSDLPRQRLDFAYDHRGRRAQKIVFEHDGNGWVQMEDLRFIYDGWNLIAELDDQGEPVRTHTWGTDLSGSAQGAGGVGGLLWTEVHEGTGTELYYMAYDGNGNVMGAVSESDGTVSASFEYSPFGVLLVVEGEAADDLPLRFSTKYEDEESGYLYYGYRYYNPEIGRWINRDPIGEKGGVNTIAFTKNNGVSNIDILGLLSVSINFRAYIPDELGSSVHGKDGFWIREPLPFGLKGWYYNTGTKVVSETSSAISGISIGNLEGKEDVFVNKTGLTKRILTYQDKAGRLAWQSPREEEREAKLSNDLVLVEDIDVCTSFITIQASAAYPFFEAMSLTPRITLNLRVLLRFRAGP